MENVGSLQNLVKKYWTQVLLVSFFINFFNIFDIIFNTAWFISDLILGVIK